MGPQGQHVGRGFPLRLVWGLALAFGACEGASDAPSSAPACGAFNASCAVDSDCCEGLFCGGFDPDLRCWPNEGSPCSAHDQCQPPDQLDEWQQGCFDGVCYDCRRTATTGKRPCGSDADCCPQWYCSFVTGGGWCERGGCSAATCSGCQYIGSENCCYHCSNDRCVQSCSF